MNYAVYCDLDYLQHHGILGQKWGVRRFQNPDGTLTEEGKKRYLRPSGRYDSYQILQDYARGGFAKHKVARNLMRDELEKTSAYSDVERNIKEYLKSNPKGDIYDFFDRDEKRGFRSESKMYREIANILDIELRKNLNLTNSNDPMLAMAQNFIAEIWGKVAKK